MNRTRYENKHGLVELLGLEVEKLFVAWLRGRRDDTIEQLVVVGAAETRENLEYRAMSVQIDNVMLHKVVGVRTGTARRTTATHATTSLTLRLLLLLSAHLTLPARLLTRLTTARRCVRQR